LETLKSLAYLVVGEIFAALQRCLAMVHCFDEAAFFVEILRDDFLDQLVGIASLLSGRDCASFFSISGAKFTSIP